MRTGVAVKKHDGQSFWRHFRRGKAVRVNLENVLGTSLEMQLVVDREQTTRRAESALLDEIDRLASILDERTGVSELAAWQKTLDCDAAVSPELAEVLALANRWRAVTHGAFHPAAVALRQATRNADRRELVAQLREPLWTVDENRGVARRLSTLPVSLDALAKGYIVSRAASRVYDVPGVSHVLLNVGGDVEHLGADPVAVGVADPFAAAENGDLLATVRLQDEALATSGGYRRGSHIVDPRSGDAVSRVASASVIAPDCATADALSTAFCVLDPVDSLAIAESLTGVGCLIVETDGRTTTSTEWNNHASLPRR